MEDEFDYLRFSDKVYSDDGNRTAIIFMREYKKVWLEAVATGKVMIYGKAFERIEANPDFQPQNMNWKLESEMLKIIADSMPFRDKPSDN